MSDSVDGACEVVEDFPFIGRTLSEYRHFLAVEPADLADGTILDCAAGPSSFTAEASALGADATAVDPAYRRPLAELETGCAAATERTVEQLQEKHDRFRWAFYGDVGTRIRLLRAASERFLADVVREPPRYVAAALPSLPFESDAFDPVLSAHFLFLDDGRLPLSFHVSAARELARVAAGEVRVFPLVSLAFERSAYVGDVVEALRADDPTVDVVEVPFEFQRGATEMLRISDVRGYDGGS